MTDRKEKRPNLFIVGSMKSATTSLHNYLDLHPDIFMTKGKSKEPHFFVEELNFVKNIDEYLSLFDGATNEKYLGESSTGYTKAPHYSGVPERIHAFCPNAKIIYIMRDPIERAISQYWWEVEYSAEGRKMPVAIIRNDWAMNTSNYALQLRPYIELFGIENVFTLTTEELVTSPDNALRKIFSWLNVASELSTKTEFKTYNRTADEVNQVIGSSIFSHLKGTKFWELMKTIVPDSSLRRNIKRFLSRPVKKNDDDREEAIALLRPIMQEQVKELSELLGKDFPEWQAVHGKKTP